MDVKLIYKKCLAGIDKNNPDVSWYLHSRPSTITRKSFFEAAAYAIWAGGKNRKAAEKIMKHAKQKGFKNDYSYIAAWDKQKLKKFVVKLYGTPVKKGSYKRWESILNIAKKIKHFPSEVAFRASYFGGKVKSVDLKESDVQRLVSKDFSFIRETNARFILRNMGGEFIKPDIWLKAFMKHFRTPLNKLEQKLSDAKIPLGLFDAVVWLYCVEHVKKTKYFASRFLRCA